jgi:hypothetical protein
LPLCISRYQPLWCLARLIFMQLILSWTSPSPASCIFRWIMPSARKSSSFDTKFSEPWLISEMRKTVVPSSFRNRTKWNKSALGFFRGASEYSAASESITIISKSSASTRYLVSISSQPLLSSCSGCAFLILPTSIMNTGSWSISVISRSIIAPLSPS